MSRRKNPYTADARTKVAKQKGYPARSVFKLDEIDRRVGLLRPGQRVLDLGAAPGSWSLYASRRVGGAGRVLAVDLQEIAQTFSPNVSVLLGDVRDLAGQLISDQQPFDVVLSDMAPSTTGNKVADQAGSYELFCAALDVAVALGSIGSHFVAKLFMGPDYERAKQQLAAEYATTRTIRPRGTRQHSSEVFLVGLDKRRGPTSRDPGDGPRADEPA